MLSALKTPLMVIGCGGLAGSAGWCGQEEETLGRSGTVLHQGGGAGRVRGGGGGATCEGASPSKYPSYLNGFS